MKKAAFLIFLCTHGFLIEGTVFFPFVLTPNLQGYNFQVNRIWMVETRSILECAAMCLNDGPSCQSTTFDRLTQSCVGFNTVFLDLANSISSKNSSYFSIQTCPDPPVVDNATVLPGSNMYNTLRTYECERTHTLIGDPTIKCLSGGWSPVNVTCVPNSCGSPPDVNRALVQTDGLVRNYTCDYGYVQNGTHTSTYCQSNGNYSLMDISCNDCAEYASTYSLRSGMKFEPPGFARSFSGESIKLSFCIDTCNQDTTCKSVYFRDLPDFKYCRLVSERVYDKQGYSSYYVSDPEYEEYIRDCNY